MSWNIYLDAKENLLLIDTHQHEKEEILSAEYNSPQEATAMAI